MNIINFFLIFNTKHTQHIFKATHLSAFYLQGISSFLRCGHLAGYLNTAQPGVSFCDSTTPKWVVSVPGRTV